MTASFTLARPNVFPNGTTVKAYPVTNWPTPNLPSGAPIGSSAAEATMTSGTLTFSGLTQGTSYWAVAEVGGVYRYVGFIAGADLAGADLSPSAKSEVETLIAEEGASSAETVNVVGNAGTAQTVDLSKGTVHRYTLNKATLTFTFPTPAAGKSFTLHLTQDSTGGRLVTWPASTRWSNGVYPTLSTAKEAIDIIYFECFDGEHWAGFPGGYAFAAGGSSETVAPAVTTAIAAEEARAKAAEELLSNRIQTGVLGSNMTAIKESTVLTNIEGLGVAIGASATEIWRVSFWVLLEAANATMDVKFGFSVPASATASWGGVGNPASANDWGAVSTATEPILLGTASSELKFGVKSGGVVGVLLAATIIGGGTAGTVQLKVAQATSDAGNLQILKGSAFEARKLAS